MKYQIKNIIIPQERRKEINEKCLYVIDNNLNALTPEIVFNSYTGEGGLHGLSFNDYNSFYSYTEAKKEIEQGQFFTPHNICKFIIDCLKPSKTDITADLTSGMGNFANYLPVEENIYLNELDIKAVKVVKYLYPKANITNEDIRHFEPQVKFDLIVGNPPFNLRWSMGKDDYLSQLYYCIKASQLLKPAGLMALIVPNSFLKDEFADGGMIKEINTHFNFICQFDIPVDSFKNVGVNHFETKIMLFQKKSEHLQDREYNTSKITINNISEQQANYIYNTYVKPLQEQKEKIKNKLFFENLHSEDSEENKEFAFKVKKLLYDIKRNPKINNNYGKCFEYVNKYYTQKQPEGMKWEEWQKVRLTKNKVVSYLKRTLQKQNIIEQDKIQLVKTAYILKLKGYSQKNKLYLSKFEGTKEFSINDAVFYNNYPFADKTYSKLIQRKRNEFLNQTEDFNNINEDAQINNYLNNLIFYDSVQDKEIRLNDVQKLDINKILQKKYGFIQYSMGGGKTLLGMTYALYRMQYNNINNPIVIGESIAIRGTWIEKLENCNIDFVLIEKLEDFQKIQKGQFILMTLYTANKYKKYIKKYLKMNNKKFALIFDESDSITSLDTQAYKATLNCFRASVQYKLLMTGTSTRNNTNEVFGQLELLYNNSINMLCVSEYIYDTDKKENEIKTVKNEYLNKPFPAYKKGFNLFRQTFSPSKVTVFGLDKYNQDIYNSDDLSTLLNYTIITKTFKEITGREPFDGKVIACQMNIPETMIYDKIVKEFHELERLYYSSTGNSRKDAMLKALHQLNLLLRACSRFHMISGFTGKNISTKHIEVIDYIKTLGNQRIAIGCIEKASCAEYQRILHKAFPSRQIFVVDGERYNINQRKKLIKEFKKYEDCIVISTQESLSCSLNIGFIDEIIIPELQWNNSRIEQFAFRFIRYDSINLKNVRFFLYANSIEINVLKLIMVKEKINLFMKGEDWTEEQLKAKYGIDFEMEQMLMYKERDEEGNLKIVWNQWGDQKII